MGSKWTVALSCLLAATMMITSACQKDAPVKKTGTKDDAAKSVEAKDGDKTAAAGSACADYSAKFCEVTGANAQSCQALKSLNDLLPPKACEEGAKDLEFTKTAVAELGKKCDELMNKLCKDLGEDTKTCEMVRQSTPQFPPERCSMMLGSYDQVLAELKQQEEMNKPLTAEKQALIAGSDAPSFGPLDAPITLVEFSDFECPYCTMAAGAVNKIKTDYKGKVRVVFRQFPLSFHPNAHLASQAALAAHAQGKFWEYHDKLFANQKALQRADLDKYAKELKLDMGKFKKALDEGTYKAQVDKDMEMAKTVVVQGTPTMFLNGERVPNATQFDAIKPLLDKALEKK